MLAWIEAAGGLLSAIGALAAAFVAVFALRRQESANIRALAAQAQATNDARDHERRLALDERVWNRRVDLYIRLADAMREHLHVEGDLGDVPLLASLVSEADILASQEVRDLLGQFMFGNPDVQTKIDLWDRMVTAARKELVARAVGYLPGH
ncbi:hypothetical protein [Micromonospora psammae]|uniref:hypothetical protein n=1 Tax=Micromonospora sp. CPCC 205556 TaxID=3122398 RepID=UPI002FF1C7B4